MARKTGGVAGSDGGPGEESGTGESRGTQVEAMSSESQPAEALQLRGATSDSAEFATAAAQETPSGEGGRNPLICHTEKPISTQNRLTRRRWKGIGFLCGIGSGLRII